MIGLPYNFKKRKKLQTLFHRARGRERNDGKNDGFETFNKIE